MDLIGKKLKVSGNEKNDGKYGLALENLLGIKANNSQDADMHDGDLKSFNENSNVKLNLFSKSPNGRGSLRKFFKKFYIKHEVYDINIFNQDLSTTHWTEAYGKYRMKLYVDRKNEKLYVIVDGYDDVLCWDFSILEERLGKIKNIHLVSHNTDTVSSYKYYTGLTMKKFIDAIEFGIIMLCFRYDVTSSGKRHDHGCEFKIKNRKDINKLYN